MPEQQFTLYDYFRILKRRKWMLIGSTCVFMGFTLFFTLRQTSLYQASSQIEIIATGTGSAYLSSAKALLGMIGGNSVDEDPVDSAANGIKSHAVMLEVLKNFGEVNEQTSAQEIENKIVVLVEKISIKRPQTAGKLLNIIITSSNRLETARLSNIVAETYLRWTSEQANKENVAVVKNLKEKMTKAEEKVKMTEEELKNFQKTGFIPGYSGVLAGNLHAAKNLLSELKKKYTANHPMVLEKQQQINTLEKELKAATEKELEWRHLEREAVQSLAEYQSLKLEYEKSEAVSNFKVETAQLISKAQVPSSPVSPNKRLNLTVGFIAGILIGVISSIVIEYLDTSITTIEDVEQFLQLPVIGIIPYVLVEDDREKKTFSNFFKKPILSSEPHELTKKLILLHDTQSSLAEAFRTLRANLSFVVSGANKRTLVFLSAGPSEGKTITVANYALASAEAGMKTLLVEADFRHPQIHKLFRLNRDPGFTDLISDRADWEHVLKGTTDFLLGHQKIEQIMAMPGIENLKIITAGTPVQNPIDMFEGNIMDEIIKTARNKFDVVLFDCPPLLLFADGLILSKKVDGVVIVYRIGRIARGALKRAKTQLDNVKAPLVGVVINGLRTGEGPYYTYYTHKYYGSKKP